jgi:hypothetical protein
MTNPFSSPAAPGAGAPAPRPRDLEGCLVAYAPRVFTPAGAPGNTTGVGKSDPRDRVTTDVYLLESIPGRPVLFGGSPDYEADPKPHTHTVTGPARWSGAWVSNSNIVKALAPDGHPLVGQMLLGRIARSEVGNKPWNLVDVAGTPDMDKAIAIWSALQMGGATYNEPIPLNPTAAAAANSISYAPSPTPPAPTAWTVPPTAPVPNGAPAAPPVDPAYAAWLATQPVPQPPAPPVAPTGPPPHLQAQGWTATSWATLTPAQQGQVLAATPVA